MHRCYRYNVLEEMKNEYSTDSIYLVCCQGTWLSVRVGTPGLDMPGENMKPKKQVAMKNTGGLPRSRKSGTDTSANGSVADSNNGHGMEVDINTESHAPGTSSRSTSKSRNNNKRKASASGSENVSILSPPDSDAESVIHLPDSVSCQLKSLKLGGGADQFLELGPLQDLKERREIRRKYSQLREEAQGLIKRVSFKAYTNKTIIYFNK